MKNSTYLPHLLLAFSISLIAIITPVNGQSSTVCTGAMVRSFGPCLGYLTTGSNASRPSNECCNSLRDLMSNGQDCLCVIVTGGVPFQVPLNQTLAISLPRACRMSGVPVECKATASPAPAPEPENPGQDRPNVSPSPRSSPPSSPTEPFTPQLPPPSPPAEGGRSPPLTPEGGRSTPEGDTVPTLTPPGMRPTLTSSAAQYPFHSVLPSLLAILGVILFMKCY